MRVGFLDFDDDDDDDLDDDDDDDDSDDSDGGSDVLGVMISWVKVLSKNKIGSKPLSSRTATSGPPIRDLTPRLRTISNLTWRGLSPPFNNLRYHALLIENSEAFAGRWTAS
jgi:hypothetical protein